MEQPQNPIAYYSAQADAALSDALYLVEDKRWNAAVNRLYYSCYYAVSALLLRNGIEAKTHKGVKDQLNLLFVKTGLLDKEQGKLFADLFNARQKSDYGDFYNFDEASVRSLVTPVHQFLTTLKQLL